MNLLNRLEKIVETRTDLSFKDLTSLKIGGKIAYVVYPKDIDNLKEVINLLNETNTKYKFLGKGSNILCGDAFYDGCVIKLEKYLNKIEVKDETMYAEAGASVIVASNVAREHSLSGLEFASGIPGSIGGCVYMNAGAYNKQTSDILEKILVYRDKELVWMDAKNLNYQYRTSDFQLHPDWNIIACTLKLEKADQVSIGNLMATRRERRQKAQPLDLPSCGSTFRNPIGAHAWQCVDGIGYRGKRIGGIMVSDKHVNFLVNVGDATCEDFLTMVNEIQTRVKERYKIELNTEVEHFNCD